MKTPKGLVLIVSLFLFVFNVSAQTRLRYIPKAYAVSCTRSDTGTTTLNSACTLDGVPKYDVSGNEISRVGIINAGDLTVSGADVTIQPNTTIVWPLGKSINIQSGGRILFGAGSSLTQAEPLTYQFQNLGFTVNAAGDPVKIVNNNLQVCSGTTCSIAAPAGAGHAVVEGQLKVGSTFIIDGSGNVGVGTTSPGTKLQVAGNIDSSTGAIQTGGVTRIDNSGVGTFASGTTIGGATVGGGGPGINSVQTFAATGTWTKPSGVTKVIVEVQGSGGGGGGAAGDASYGMTGYYGGKGGAGGFCRKIVDVSALSTVAVTIGAPGTGGNRGYGGNGDDTSGTAGGVSSFGTYCTANGGGGGQRGQWGGGGTGGTSTGGDVNVTGAAGSPCYSPWYGRYFGLGLNDRGHGGNGGECCGNPYALGNNGYVGTAGSVVVWEYK